MPDKQREILVLRVVVGLSAEQTADAVGSTPGAVRVAQHRALSRLRRTVKLGMRSARHHAEGRNCAPVAPPGPSRSGRPRNTGSRTSNEC